MNFFPSDACRIVLDRVFIASPSTIMLYKNDHVPGPSDTIADYVQADFGGYFPDLPLAWNAAWVNMDGEGENDATQMTWICNGINPNTIYGVCVKDAGGDLIYAERFAAPVVMSNPGDQIDYTPSVTAASS